MRRSSLSRGWWARSTGCPLLGLCSEEVRLPLVGLTEGTKGRIRDAMRHAGLIN